MSELAHNQVVYNTRSTRTASTYGDLGAGARTIPSTDFTVGNKYLLLIWTLYDVSNSNGNGWVRVVHGSTAFADSEEATEPASATTNRIPYFYWEEWTAVSGEAITLQFRTTSASHTIGADQTVMAWIDITNLTYSINRVSTNDDLSATFLDGASVTFDGTSGDDWLLLHLARLDPAVATVQIESQAVLSGTAWTGNLTSREPGDANDFVLATSGRGIALTSTASHTFKEQSREETDSAGTRTHSKVFAMKLTGVFVDISKVYSQTTEDYQTGSFGDLLSTLSHTKTAPNGDVLILSFCRDDFTIAGAGTGVHHRLQVGDADAIDTTQTADNYDTRGSLNDAQDQSMYKFGGFVAVTGNITIDHDGDSTSALTDAEDRGIVAFSMELVAVSTENMNVKRPRTALQEIW